MYKAESQNTNLKKAFLSGNRIQKRNGLEILKKHFTMLQMVLKCLTSCFQNRPYVL